MWFYNFGLILYVWAIRLVAPRHPKARLWIEGRKDLFRRMREAIAPTDRIIWIHVASLGEFEQGRPIIEQLRKTHPEYKAGYGLYELRHDARGDSGRGVLSNVLCFKMDASEYDKGAIILIPDGETGNTKVEVEANRDMQRVVDIINE